MSLGRHLAVVAVSLLTALAYSPLHFAPAWYERLGAFWQIALLLTPVPVSFACGLLVGWWRWQACLTYCGLVMLWSIFGVAYDRTEPMCACGLDVWVVLPQALAMSMLFVWLPSASAWALGRVVRARVHGDSELTAEGGQPSAT